MAVRAALMRLKSTATPTAAVSGRMVSASKGAMAPLVVPEKMANHGGRPCYAENRYQ